MNLSPYQTLDALDRASMKIPGKHMKISWLILSRVGIHYLSSTFGSWTICQIHRKEFLDTWQVPAKCTHPDHNIMNDQIPCVLPFQRFYFLGSQRIKTIGQRRELVKVLKDNDHPEEE